MAKKQRAKDKREALNAQRRQKYQQTASQAEETKTVETAVPEVKKQKSKHSGAKAAGLKSTFVLPGGELLMTSFGKGNEAVLEKRIDGDTITDLNDERAFTVERDGENTKRFNLWGRGNIGGSADDPSPKTESVAGMDLIGAKDALELRFFGRTFTDNIHIQLIYNILDIEKILAVHLNNIVFAIDNLLRRQDERVDDFAGYLSLKNTYQVFLHPEKSITASKTLHNIENSRTTFNELMKKPQLGYFGDVFRPEQLRSGKETTRKSVLQDNYYYLCLLGEARQMLFHDKDDTRTAIYTLEDCFDTNSGSVARKEAKEALNKLYKTQIDGLNKGFLQHSEKDIFVLSKVLRVSTKEDLAELTRKYYSFVVRKDYKNLGFSVKKLRELMLERAPAGMLKDAKHDTYRQKVNRALDFLITEYYLKKPERIERFVERLRASRQDEEKEALYSEQARGTADSLNEAIKLLIEVFEEKKWISINKPGDNEGNTEFLLQENWLDDCRITAQNTSYFSQQVYLYTKFLDGKEINDLLTTLISKFESIAAFWYVLTESKNATPFTEDYTLFADSGKIAAELRVINSFARMSKQSPASKRAMYIEAAQILGTRKSEEELGKYFDELLDPKNKDKEHRGNGFRNFIANNVIDSNRFKYLVRYNNSSNTRKLANSKPLVRFVLQGIPDDQIVRYYNSCKGTDIAYNDSMRQELAKKISGISFDAFATSNYDRYTMSQKEKEEKERDKNIIRLYLTVLYLLTKNLVYVNSRYTLAIHCYERDTRLLKADKEKPLALTEASMDRKKKRVQTYLQVNKGNFDKWIWTGYGNQIRHLNAIRTAHRYLTDWDREVQSYFALYHYLLQMCMKAACDSLNEKEKQKHPAAITKSYFDKVTQYKTYCKDFVKAVNLPFAYNLVRYKNLSIDELFDRNYLRPVPEEERNS